MPIAEQLITFFGGLKMIETGRETFRRDYRSGAGPNITARSMDVLALPLLGIAAGWSPDSKFSPSQMDVPILRRVSTKEPRRTCHTRGAMFSSEYIDTESMSVPDEIVVLEKVAREVWDESWTIQVTRLADGSHQSFACRSRGLANPDSDDGLYELERLIFADERFYDFRREVYRLMTVADFLDREDGRTDDLTGLTSSTSAPTVRDSPGFAIA